MMNIVCNIDKNYVRHCAVTLVSVFVNNPRPTTVYVIHNDLTPADQDSLRSIAAGYGKEVRFCRPDVAMLEGLEIKKFSKRITMATYFRCLISDILPESVSRVLYLDCDIIVRGDLSPFYDMPLDGVGVAAVADIGCNEPKRYEILKYPMEDSYFNAGVLLVNLDYWRKQQVSKACIDYYHAYPERILFNDQDLLNSILHQHKQLVDVKWNVQDGFYRNRFPAELREQYKHALTDPVVLHYTNRKPWDYDSQHPLRHEYRKYLDLTPWKGDYPWATLSSRIKRFFRLLPFYMGLRRPKYAKL